MMYVLVSHRFLGLYYRFVPDCPTSQPQSWGPLEEAYRFDQQWVSIYGDLGDGVWEPIPEFKAFLEEAIKRHQTKEPSDVSDP